MKIIFFGSTTDSLLVLEKLSGVVAIVTQPPRPVGRKKIITPTPVEIWGKAHQIPVLTFPHDKDKPWLFTNETQIIDTLSPFKADLLISASYGQKIPSDVIQKAKFGGLNVHPSLLPRWRGGDPVPWAILSGDAQIGVTVVTLSDTFDAGRILGQKKIPIHPNDTSNPLRTHLFEIGADLLVNILPDYLSGKNKGKEQIIQNEPRAKRFSRDDGFEPWENIINPKEAARINRKFRAFHPWPGLWSLTPSGKRIKILDFTHTPILIQVEGGKPASITSTNLYKLGETLV